MIGTRRRRYTATIGGHGWAQGPEAEFGTIREARAWAETFGTTADYCTISDAGGRIVASHRRDPNNGGARWIRATP